MITWRAAIAIYIDPADTPFAGPVSHQYRQSIANIATQLGDALCIQRRYLFPHIGKYRLDGVHMGRMQSPVPYRVIFSVV